MYDRSGFLQLEFDKKKKKGVLCQIQDKLMHYRGTYVTLLTT